MLTDLMDILWILNWKWEKNDDSQLWDKKSFNEVKSWDRTVKGFFRRLFAEVSINVEDLLEFRARVSVNWISCSFSYSFFMFSFHISHLWKPEKNEILDIYAALTLIPWFCYLYSVQICTKVWYHLCSLFYMGCWRLKKYYRNVQFNDNAVNFGFIK